MSTRRNDPCPCGSGKKYKQCHGKPTRTQLSSEESAWRRLRDALDGYPTMMLRFVRDVYGPWVVHEAWAEFTLWEDEEAGFDPDSDHLQVFMPWFFHRWSPDPHETNIEDAFLHGRCPTSVLLERKGSRLQPVLRAYFEACLTTPFSFHEIVRADTGHGFLARDVFTLDGHEVLDRSASRTLQPGDIFFGQVVSSGGITLMEACSPHAMLPREKVALIDLRESIARGGPPPSAEMLLDWDAELREEYLEWVKALTNPPPPRLHNTDGEPIAFHRLRFEVPSAQGAFDVLYHLTYDDSEIDLLESAERDAQGRLQRVSFPWIAAGNAIHASWDSTALGHIEIDGHRLEANVNSAGRAARLKEIVESSYPDARHVSTDVETVEEARARSRHSAGDQPPEDPDAAALASHPEVLDRVRAMSAAHYEGWVHQEIPALGGLSPMEAIEEMGGREKVEALIAQIERDGRRMVPPLDVAVIQRMRERLGLVD